MVLMYFVTFKRVLHDHDLIYNSVTFNILAKTA